MPAVASEQLRSGAVEVGTRCNVYRNLNLRKYGVVGWSIQAKDGKAMHVKQHAKCVLLSDVTFKHATNDQANRVKAECREVCAWLKGTFRGSCLSGDFIPGAATWENPVKHTEAIGNWDSWRAMHCCPKKNSGEFCDKETKVKLDAAKYVFVDNEGNAWYVPQEETNGRS
jgi:hypothetical protein